MGSAHVLHGGKLFTGLGSFERMGILALKWPLSVKQRQVLRVYECPYTLTIPFMNPVMETGHCPDLYAGCLAIGS